MAYCQVLLVWSHHRCHSSDAVWPLPGFCLYIWIEQNPAGSMVYLSNYVYMSYVYAYKLQLQLHCSCGPVVIPVKVKKGRALVTTPLSRYCTATAEALRYMAHTKHHHIPALYLPSRSRYSFTDPREDGGLSKPRPRVQRATGPRLLRDCPWPAGLEPTTSRSLIKRVTMWQ